MTDLSLVIPTYRIEHIASTIRSYSANMAKFGHDIPIVVFDDSDRSDYKDFLRGLGPKVYYVGRAEKIKFIEAVRDKRDAKKSELVRRMFRKGYGGNRNVILAYMQHQAFVSIDDDMRPHGLFSSEIPELEGSEVSRGVFMSEADKGSFYGREDDLMGEYLKLLGKELETCLMS